MSPLLHPACTLRLGTQGWSYADWLGSFYPSEAKAADYLELYSSVFDTVEIDSTFYGAPRPSSVQAWAEHTPPHFEFAAKLPQRITHELALLNADAELGQFLHALEPLGEKLGPLLIQMPPQFHRDADTWAAVRAFLAALPGGYKWAMEFRHRSWLQSDVLEELRAHKVAWTCIDLTYMPRLIDWTADFAYVRWLGDRRAIERYDRPQIERDVETEEWADALAGLSRHVSRIYGYYNNHYAGHSPASVNQLRAQLNLPPLEPPPVLPGTHVQENLF
jgi:uncharacterized protein YecE (DUF72 family)